MSGGNMGKVVLVTLCFVIAACAASPPSRPGSAGVRAPRAFIEVTAVDVPEQISGASLVNVMREADVAWGVNAFYRADALPQARFDLFVYPAGRMPAAIGARLGQDSFVGGLESMRTQEAHGRFEILGEEAFPVPVIGRPALDVFKTRLRVEINDRMHASRAYIGWRRDYFLKLRVSAPPEDEGTLDTVADASFSPPRESTISATACASACTRSTSCHPDNPGCSTRSARMACRSCFLLHTTRASSQPR